MSKIAVPTRGGQVDEHFGHCEAFLVYTVDESRTITGETGFAPPQGCGCKSNLAGMLKEMGVTTLVAGNMGQGAALKLHEQGIRVVRGAFGPARDAVQAWLDGRLKDNLGVCQAHGHDCAHG